MKKTAQLPSHPRWDILTVGDATLDIFLNIPTATAECSVDTHQCLLCLSYADKVPIESLVRVVGGNAANSAVGLARLGLKAAMYGVIGNDSWSHHIKQTLQSEKVDTSYLTLTKGQEANTAIVLCHKGERTILSYHVPRKYIWPSTLPTCRYLYLTSMRHGFEKNYPQILGYIKRTGAKLIFQPGTQQLLLGINKLKPILKQTELLILNREEAVELLKVNNQTSVKDLLVKLLKLGPRLISITDGGAGAWGSDGKNYYQMSAFPGRRVEATGAGDAYASAVTAALIVGKSFKEAMAWGTVNSASVIGQIGPQAGLLKRVQLETRLKKAKSYQAKVYTH